MRLAMIVMAWLLLLSGSQAQLLIYKGTRRVATVPSGTEVAFSNVYAIYDRGAHQMAMLQFWQQGARKRMRLLGNATLFVGETGFAPGIRTMTEITSPTTTDADNFSAALSVFRGKQVALTVKTTGGAVAVSEPRTLVGTQLSSLTSRGFSYASDVKFALSFVSSLTLQENNAGKSAGDAFNDLWERLYNQGYRF